MTKRAQPPDCPTCRKPMALARSVPRVGTMPEIESFKCGTCGQVTTEVRENK